MLKVAVIILIIIVGVNTEKKKLAMARICTGVFRVLTTVGVERAKLLLYHGRRVWGDAITNLARFVCWQLGA